MTSFFLISSSLISLLTRSVILQVFQLKAFLDIDHRYESAVTDSTRRLIEQITRNNQSSVRSFSFNSDEESLRQQRARSRTKKLSIWLTDWFVNRAKFRQNLIVFELSIRYLISSSYSSEIFTFSSKSSKSIISRFTLSRLLKNFCLRKTYCRLRFMWRAICSVSQIRRKRSCIKNKY